ncbi:MAG: DEAD/DEAH box helicase, partial [Nocardioides sp.]
MGEEAASRPSRDRAAAEEHLRALVGSPDAVLRDDQWTAIQALVDRRRALVVQRTGWGKSAVYFVSTLLLRAAGSGPTVIVSPLLALMRNQITAAERAGIRAVTINSSNVEEWEPIQEAVAAGEVDVLLVSPERLNNPGFRDQVLPRLAATCGLLVVDEAHCISDWGHDFRPDYRRIRTLLHDLPAGIPVLATTATANARVSADVAEQLGPEVLVLRGSLDRESLRLGVVRLPTPERRLGWLADHLAEQPGSGIVYCLTVAATQEVADFLRSRGHHVAAYSGQTDPTERLALERQLAAGEVKALVATSALGMGFDATLGFVVNLGAPPSPVAYYQQVGRAGRGTDRASVVLLPQAEDRDIWAYFGSLAFPREDQVRHTLRVLTDEGGPLSTAALETYVDLGRTRLEQMLKVLDVDGAVRRVRGGWVATGEPWTYDAERYARVSEARRREQQAMLDYLDTDACRMWFLRDQLDDPAISGADRCGRCDRCGGLELVADVSEDALVEARARLARPGVVIEPRTLWPTALGNLGIDLKGRIGEAAEPGRAVARLTDLGHGQT